MTEDVTEDVTKDVTEDVMAVRNMTIELVCLVDGEVLVPSLTLSDLLRNVSQELGTWTGRGADPATLLEVGEMLDGLADRIDVDCMALVSEYSELGADCTA